MSVSNNINSIVKIKKIKSDLTLLSSPLVINPIRSDPENSEITTTTTGSGLVEPLTFEALTYDNTKDVVITDDGGTIQTFKQVETAKIVDANGIEYAIDTVIFN